MLLPASPLPRLSSPTGMGERMLNLRMRVPYPPAPSPRPSPRDAVGTPDPSGSRVGAPSRAQAGDGGRKWQGEEEGWRGDAWLLESGVSERKRWGRGAPVPRLGGFRGGWDPSSPGRRTHPHDVGDPRTQDPGVWV